MAATFFTDVHLSPSEHGTWKVYRRTEDRLSTAVSDVNDRDVDLVIFGGDLGRDGEPAELERFDDIVSDLESPAVAIPGNHDVSKTFDDHDSPTVPSFARRYDVDGYPFVRSVGGVDVVGLNSASMPDGSLADTWTRAVSDDQLAWLDERLPELSSPIVTVHHNLAPQPEHVDEYPWDHFPMENNERLAQTLADGGASFAISGHHHLPAVNDLPVPEVMAPALCSFPQSYLLVEIDERGTTIRMVPLADRKGMAEAWIAATTGKPHGQGTAAIAEMRLRNLPLVEQWIPVEDGESP